MSYPVPADSIETEIEIKKSRFIARATKAADRQQALAFVEQAKQDFPDARHHCWAYLLGDPNGSASAAMNDDGEPSGTAGKPILNVLQHKGVGDVVVVVIRYFGGIKLGAGGLVRAYGGAAEAVMSMLPVEQTVAKSHFSLRLAFSQEQLLRHWADQHQSDIFQVDYGEWVVVTLAVPEEASDHLGQFCSAQNIELQKI